MLFLLIFMLALQPLLAFNELMFTESPQYSVALPGDSVYFSCKTNLPSAIENITWLHDGKPLKAANSRASKGLLTFRVSKKSDEYRDQVGTYQCIGGAQGSPYKIASLKAELSIAFLGEFAPAKPKSIEAFEGNDVVIPCQVPESIPPAFVQFLKDGELVKISEVVEDEAEISKSSQILNGDTLLLTNVTESQSGNYTCVASNHITDERRMSTNPTTLTVMANSEENNGVKINGKSRLTHRPDENYEVKVGERLSLPCAASGLPKPEVTWSRIGTGTSGDNNELKAQDGVLEIAQAGRKNTGHYMCAVFNGARRFVRRTSVTVLVPPEITVDPVAFLKIQEGESLNLDCGVSGSPPPQIIWLLNGIPESSDNVNRLTGTLTLSQPSSGYYQCFASNSAGQINLSTFVQVGDDPTLSDSFDSESLDDYNDENFDDPILDQDFDGHEVVSPTKPNVTQLTTESAIIKWVLETPSDSGAQVVPVKFFKIQFREFFKGGGRSSWHTLDEDVAPDVRAFEIIGLKFDRKYRFRVVVVFENNDSKVGPLSKRFKMNANVPGLEESPKPPTGRPEITGVLPLGPTMLRIGWRVSTSGSEDNIEGYFIHFRPATSTEKYEKITIIGATSHSHIVEALIPGTQYELKVQAFNYAGVSPLSKIARQNTADIPPPVEATDLNSSNNAISSLSSPIQDANNGLVNEDSDSGEDDIQYLILAGCLAGAMIVFLAICSVISCIKKTKRNKAHHNNGASHSKSDLSMNQISINDKYNDTALQISHQHLSNLSNTHLNSNEAGAGNGNGNNGHSNSRQYFIDPGSSQNFVTPRYHHYPQSSHQSNLNNSVSMIPNGNLKLQQSNNNSNSNKNYAVSENSILSSTLRDHVDRNRDFRNAASVESLGNEEYSDEPSRLSWRRGRKSEESFI